MARTFSFPSQRFEGFAVSPNDLTVNAAQNGRAFEYEEEDFQDLFQDFEAGKGVTTPIIVRSIKLSDGGKGLAVVAGYRRALAARSWAQTHPDFVVPVVLEPLKDEDKLGALELNIRENVARKSLSHIDLGHNAQRLIDLGKTPAESATILGVSPAQVTQHLRLVNEFSERIQLLIHQGKLTADEAYAVLNIQDPEEREKFILAHLAEEENEGESEEAPQSLREKVRKAGHSVGSMRMPEFKKYLKQAIEEAGPGSNKGEVGLKQGILEFLEGKLTNTQMDSRFGKFCKVGG